MIAALWIGIRDAGAQPYRIVPLEPLPGTTRISVLDLNNDLQTVGTSDGLPTVWDRNGRPRLLPVSRVTSLVINNAGLIAGTRLPTLSRFPLGSFQAFAIVNGTDYVDLPTPPHANLLAMELTDNGILLLWTATASPSWALYQSQLHNLYHDFRDVSDDGMTGGFVFVSDNRGRVRRVGLLRWSDGREVVPWPEEAAVSVVGPHAHFAGESCTLQLPGLSLPEECTVLYGRPDGSLIRRTFVGARQVQLRDINRAGDLVGSVSTPNTPRDLVFLLHGGQFIDLNEFVTIPGRQLCHASRITDQGAILAFEQQSGRVGFCQPILLIPTEPATPASPTFTISNRIVTLQWQAVIGATDYIVEVGSAPERSDLYRASVGSVLSVTTPVPPGRYFVRVRARNAVGISGPSNEVIIDVP